MTKIIIATLILLTFPIFSRADGGVLEGISISANTSVDTKINTNVSTSSNSVNTIIMNADTNSQNDNISATTTTKTDGLFQRVINWFKSLFN